MVRAGETFFVGGNYASVKNATENDLERIAGDGQVHGLFEYTVEYCKSIASNIRIDTHADNATMQRLIEKNGFTKCGTIYVRDGSPRIAYQWSAVL